MEHTLDRVDSAFKIENNEQVLETKSLSSSMDSGKQSQFMAKRIKVEEKTW